LVAGRDVRIGIEQLAWEALRPKGASVICWRYESSAGANVLSQMETKVPLNRRPTRLMRTAGRVRAVRRVKECLMIG